jgi:hypothetical protein
VRPPRCPRVPQFLGLLWAAPGGQTQRKRGGFTDLRILGGSRQRGGGVDADLRIKLPPVSVYRRDSTSREYMVARILTHYRTVLQLYMLTVHGGDSITGYTERCGSQAHQLHQNGNGCLQYGQLNRTMRATAQATANAHHAERASSRKQKTACRTATVPEGQEAQQERLGSLVRRLGGAVVYKAVGRPGVKPKPVLRPLCPCGLPHSLTCRRRAECAL